MTEQAQVGDTVRISIEGVVYEAGGILLVDGWYVNSSDRTVEILSRAIQPLPSEPGTLHLDRNGDFWRVGFGGELLCQGFPGRNHAPKGFAPFRQLVLK